MTKLYQSIILFVFMAVFFSGCAASKVEQSLMKSESKNLLTFNKRGEAVVISTKTGKILPTCEERGSNNPCKFVEDEKLARKITIVKKREFDIIDFIGSNCRIYIDRATGKKWEECDDK